MLKFTIRELLLLTVIVAMGAGWTFRERRLSAQASRWRLRAHALADELANLCVVTKIGESAIEIEHATNGKLIQRTIP
jgi:hypothetical protein